MTRECDLCHLRGESIRPALVEWAQPPDGRRTWDTVFRCDDRAACRARLEAVGEPWPLAELRGSDLRREA
jgi:hypothetical protein